LLVYITYKDIYYDQNHNFLVQIPCFLKDFSGKIRQKSHKNREFVRKKSQRSTETADFDLNVLERIENGEEAFHGDQHNDVAGGAHRPTGHVVHERARPEVQLLQLRDGRTCHPKNEERVRREQHHDVFVDTALQRVME
jgi:hypothetical protein